MEWLTNQFQGNASVEDSLVYGISRAARKACAGITFILFSLATSAQTAGTALQGTNRNIQTAEQFKKAVSEGIPDTLPPVKPYEPEINHAPKRKDILSKEEKKLGYGLYEQRKTTLRL
jgi:hypothetical protein